MCCSANFNSPSKINDCFIKRFIIKAFGVKCELGILFLK
uniref:Uncharacterized protein n=1 Tax=Anguilla anguilla TaxID=7936 RepID=A0A0E9PWJ1_ANGAN